MRTVEFRQLWRRKHPEGTVSRYKDGLRITYCPTGKQYFYRGANWQLAEQLGLREAIDIPAESQLVVDKLVAGANYACSFSACSDTIRALWGALRQADQVAGWIKSESTGKQEQDHEKMRYWVMLENAWI